MLLTEEKINEAIKNSKIDILYYKEFLKQQQEKTEKEMKGEQDEFTINTSFIPGT